MPRLPPLQPRAALGPELPGFDVWTTLETLSITAEDGLRSVTVAGRPLTVKEETVIKGDYGVLKVLLRQVEGTGGAGYELDYSYLLNERARHLDGKGADNGPGEDAVLESFVVVVTGIDDDTDSIDLDVEIVDDLPALFMTLDNDNSVPPGHEAHEGYEAEGGAFPGGTATESASGSLMEGVLSVDAVTLGELEYLDGNGVWQKAIFADGKATIAWQDGTELTVHRDGTFIASAENLLNSAPRQLRSVVEDADGHRASGEVVIEFEPVIGFAAGDAAVQGRGNAVVPPVPEEPLEDLILLAGDRAQASFRREYGWEDAAAAIAANSLLDSLVDFNLMALNNKKSDTGAPVWNPWDEDNGQALYFSAKSGGFLSPSPDDRPQDLTALFEPPSVDRALPGMEWAAKSAPSKTNDTPAVSALCPDEEGDLASLGLHVKLACGG